MGRSGRTAAATGHGSARVTAAVVVAFVLLASLTPATARSEEPLAFPSFTFEGVAFEHGELTFNPTNEWDFPSVIRVGDRLTAPLGEYYLYTAPHNGRGGIALFYADSPAGPWTEYPDNPVIAADWLPHHDVSHVSSPHPIWIEDEGASRLWLYYHGENDTTRFATSLDGIAFEYGDIALTAAQAGDGVQEASYARVFEHQIPGRGNRFTMLFMDAVPGEGLGFRMRRIRLAVSDDARTWAVDPTPLVTPIEAEGTSISGPTYLPWGGRYHVVYHGSSGDIFVTDVGERFDREEHLGILHRAMETAPDDGRAAAPSFVQEGDILHMIYEAGRRGSTTIAHAQADLTLPGVVPGFDPPPLDPGGDAADDDPGDAPGDGGDGTSGDGEEPAPSGFTDVSPSSSHYDDIHTIARLGLTNGCGGTRYCPDRSLTREETATFLMRAIPLPSHRTRTRFEDVRPTSSHVPGIAALDAAKLTTGCTATRYCPDRAVTRAEMATFLMRALDLQPGTGSRYVDVRAGTTHAPAIEAIARAGLTNGCGGARFCPDRAVTRAEMASFLVRAFGLR